MDFGILGPLQVRDGSDRDAEIKGTRRRGLLLRLLVDANTFVSVGPAERGPLGGRRRRPARRRPSRATSRTSAGPSARSGSRTSRGSGTASSSAPTTRSTPRSSRTRSRAARRWRRSQPETAARILEAALTRWRGEPLLDAGLAEWALAPRERLAQIRLGAGEDLLAVVARPRRPRPGPRRGRAPHHRASARRAAVVPPHARPVPQRPAGRRAPHASASSASASARSSASLPGPEAVELERAILDQRPDLLAPRVERVDDRALPTGVSTFLLTDIVASTRIWEREPEAMGAALERHDAILERAVTECGGFLLKSRGEGDSTFSVFTPRVRRRARRSRRRGARCTRVDWPTREPLSVRMVLHTGEALERDGDYYGRTVNRAARLRSIADGDRPLVSAATAQLLADALPDGPAPRRARDAGAARPRPARARVPARRRRRPGAGRAAGPARRSSRPFALAPPPRLRERAAVRGPGRAARRAPGPRRSRPSAATGRSR